MEFMMFFYVLFIFIEIKLYSVVNNICNIFDTGTCVIGTKPKGRFF